MMLAIRGGRKLTRRELRAGGPDNVLDATAVINPRYGERGAPKWLMVHDRCVLPDDDFGPEAAPGDTRMAGLHVPRDTPAHSIRCDRCGESFKPMRRHVNIVN